jgi:hypothetical protein
MKKILTAVLAALALAGSTTQKASAWCRFNFSTGVNISWESSGGYRKFLGFEKQSYPPPGAAVGVAAPGYPAPGMAPAGQPEVPHPTPAGTSGLGVDNGVMRAAYLAHYYGRYSAQNYASPAAAPSYWYGD